jgi:hypothetical protein
MRLPRRAPEQSSGTRRASVIVKPGKLPSDQHRHGAVPTPLSRVVLKGRDPRALPLRQLLLAVSDPKACFILGAGASIGLVPLRPSASAAATFLGEQGVFGVDVVDGPERRYFIHCLLGFEVDYRSSAETYYRNLNLWLRAPGHRAYDMMWKALYLPLGAVGIWLHQQLAPRPAAAAPDAYRVFQHVPSSASIVTTNYDGQTSCCRQRVVAIHGQLSYETGLVGPRDFARETDWTLAPGDMIFPGECETTTLVKYAAFQEAVDIVGHAGSVIMVGYQFGGGADGETWEAFTKHVPRSVGVHVVNPDGTVDLTAQVRYGLQGRSDSAISKTARLDQKIYGHPLSWRDLTGAMLALLRQQRTSDIKQLIGRERQLLAEHDRRASSSR